jgi:hypothetical protein
LVLRPKQSTTELKWLTEQLGPAGDFDVLIEQRVRPMHRSSPITAELGALERDLGVKRDAGLEKAKAAVNSKRYRKLGLRSRVVDSQWRMVRQP